MSSRRGPSGSSPSWTRRARASTPRSSAAARSPARASPTSATASTATGRPCARRCSPHEPRSSAWATRAGSTRSPPTSSCTSSRGRSSRRPACRSARSPRSSACAATACRCAGRRTTRARRRWRCGATRFAGAARIALELREAARSREHVTANVGQCRRRARRRERRPRLRRLHDRRPRADGRGLAELERLVEEIVERIAARGTSRGRARADFALDPLELDAALVDAVERAAAAEGASARRMPSGAGHDAMVIGRHVPAGDDLRPEPRRHQPFAGRVQLARPGRAGDARPRARPCESPCEQV